MTEQEMIETITDALSYARVYAEENGMDYYPLLYAMGFMASAFWSRIGGFDQQAFIEKCSGAK